MSETSHFNDAPILTPESDQFGIDPFARALAQSITRMNSPVGATIAIHGKWGSGKSSAVNLIRHHLRPAIEKGDLEIIDFKCWWFRGEEALILAFFQELNAVLGKSLGDKTKELIPKLGRTLLRAGPVVGPAMNIATGGVWGAVTSGSLDFTKQFFPEGESVETIFKQLSSALAEQERRFLVIIDDIDRLTPDEALIVFRLAKSVGQLPNIIYLLVFDRELAEKAVHERYPSEGPHFLEKIIQANFEVPLPPRDDLNGAVLAEIERQCGSPESTDDLRRFMNIFYDAVAPYIESPRDVTRLSNAITVGWPPVEKEVNVADYIALEVLRLNEGKLYNAIRTNKNRVCGIRDDYGNPDNRDEELKFFLDNVSDRNRSHAETTLLRLFPRLENVGYAPDFLAQWEAERRVCTEKHFDTYFRMAIGEETLSIRDINDFIEKCGDTDFVKKVFSDAVRSVRKNGKSKVPLLFDEINVYAAKIEKEKFPALIGAIFSIGDEIDRDEDTERGFGFGNNHLRIHWLIRKLTYERCELGERSLIFMDACKEAQVGWLVDFTHSAVADYLPRDGKEPEPAEKCLVTQDDLDELKTTALEAIRTAAASGELISHWRLANILFRWRDIADDDGAEVKAWTNGQLADDMAVARFAKAFTSESWSQGMGMFGLGDRVSVRRHRAGVDGLDSILDITKFRERLEELEARGNLESPHKEYLETFLNAWREKDAGKDW